MWESRVTDTLYRENLAWGWWKVRQRSRLALQYSMVTVELYQLVIFHFTSSEVKCWQDCTGLGLN